MEAWLLFSMLLTCVQTLMPAPAVMCPYSHAYAHACCDIHFEACRDLYAAVDRKAGEAARIQRQVTIMAAVRPAHQDEFEALQAELVRLFTLYQSRCGDALFAPLL